MKHIIKIVDNISSQIHNLPDQILSNDRKKDATSRVSQLKKDCKMLKTLLSHQKEQKFLSRLVDSQLDTVEMWSEKVQTSLVNLSSLIEQLEEDIEQLEYVISSSENSWNNALSRMKMNLLRTEFIKDEDQLKELKEIETFEVEELKEIIAEEESIGKLLDDSSE